MAYADFSNTMIQWYTNIIAYANNTKPHTNLSITIDPLSEVNNVKSSAFSSDIIVMQNAAEEQVAVSRSINEMNASPQYYMDDWLEFLEWEQGQIALFQDVVSEKSAFIAATSINTQKFYQNINPDGIKHLKGYNPLLALTDEPDVMNNA